MRSHLRYALTALLSASLVTVALAADKPSNSPAPATYVITNDDGTARSFLSFFTPAGSGNATTLQLGFQVNTLGLGIAGGYFGLPRINQSPTGATPCAYASNAGSGDIAGVNVQTHTITGNFKGSDGDVGDASGIGIVVNDHYLYAGYSTSNTLGTFAVQAGCQLSFLGDIPAAGLNGGSLAGMALHGSLMVVAYADGSIESFNVSNGLPVPNGDEQNSTAFTRNPIYFPVGVDISSDGHFAIFGDSAINVTLEVSDISSGHLAATVPYTLGGTTNAVGPSVKNKLTGVNSASIRLSPDESLVYISNNEVGSVAAAFFNRTTGRVSGGCSSPSLAGFFNPWAFSGGLATRDNTGTGGVLYVAEYNGDGSSIGVVNIASNGTLCGLTESTASQVQDPSSPGLLSITTYPPRSF